MSRDNLDPALLIAALEEWRAAGGKLDALPPTDCRYARRVLAGEHTTGLDLAPVDRLLIACGLEHLLAELYPYRKTGRGGYTWPKPHPLRLLTPEQVKAAHTLHLAGGLSIRELGRRLYRQLGYSSATSCATALSSAFMRDGLPRRDRIAATIAANTTHGHGSRSDKAGYKRWRRSTIGPYPSDAKRKRSRASSTARAPHLNASTALSPGHTSGATHSEGHPHLRQ